MKYFPLFMSPSIGFNINQQFVVITHHNWARGMAKAQIEESGATVVEIASCENIQYIESVRLKLKSVQLKAFDRKHLIERVWLKAFDRKRLIESV